MSTTPVMSASSLIGDKVRNAAGEDLGKVEDFMLDTATGRVNYAVLSFGGLLGMGGKYFAVPTEALTLDTQDECFVMNASKEQLENAPGFDKDNWPNFADRNFTQSVYDHYGQRPHWQQ